MHFDVKAFGPAALWLFLLSDICRKTLLCVAFISFVTCFGLQEEDEQEQEGEVEEKEKDEQTAHPISFTWASHIAASMHYRT